MNTSPIDLDALRGHTAGPWAPFTDDSGDRPHTNIIAYAPRTQCLFSLPGRSKQEVDVKLIAAAPQLLSELLAYRARDAAVAELVAAAEFAKRVLHSRIERINAADRDEAVKRLIPALAEFRQGAARED